ncbi:TIGR03773 family transporter-associated surface protein [Occultella gossypii]|uniref:TIGR03773 family transporter-associated surface protein n=1 Tax=Occultella gossypii TaxID=2800820 RepID=A0ABS7SD73_9MICO|nr:TIGR03773 family transporter-associated surface protein [Occultella gossypii]MBZ2198306.1 TIGR03773 family transporter-associated surface protein [Occultella gossypii]
MFAVVTALVALVGTLVIPMAPTVAAERALVLDHGHIDTFNVALDESGAPILNLKEDVTGSHVAHPPEDVTLVVKEAALTALPDVANLPEGVRGVEAYYLPLSQNHDLVWPGWDSQSLAGTGYDQVDIEVQSVDGPGEVFLWSSGAFGGLTSLLTDGGFVLPNTIHQSYLAHVHANWAFTQAGEYHFTVQAFAINSTTGERVPTNTADYHWIVGDVPEPAPVPASLSVSGLTNPYEQGASVELLATPDVEAEGAVYGWETLDVTGVWVPVAGQATSTYSGVADADGQQLRARVSLGEVTVTSDPVTLEVNAAPQLPTTLTIDGLEASYEPGATVSLEAKPDVLIEGATYRWETSDDGFAWQDVEGTVGSVYSGTADTDGQRLRATIIVDGADVLTSEAVTVNVADPGPPVPSAVRIDGLADEYAEGDAVELTAVPDVEVAGVSYRWETSPDGADWATVAGQTTNEYSGTAEVDGQQIRAALLLGDDNEVTSEAVTVNVADPGPPVPSAVRIDGLADEYAEGDAVELTAVPDVEVAGVSYRWETSPDGADWATVAGQTTNEYSGTAEVDGQQIRAVLVLDGQDIATSGPVAVVLRSEAPGVCWALDIAHGHVDAFNVTLDGGAPVLTLKEDVTGSRVQHAPDEVNLVVRDAALQSFPDAASIPQALRGLPAYYLPLNQDQNLLWPGWDSQGLAGSGFDQVDISILEVDGPGEVYLWSTGSFGELDSLLVDGGYTLPGTIHQEYLAHVHANWAFTDPGAYHLRVQATAINSETGARAETNIGDYLFSVGDFEPAPDDLDCRTDVPEVPLFAPSAPDEGDLTDASRGDVSVSPTEVVAGEQVTVDAGEAVAGDYAAAFAFSEPTLLNSTVSSGWNLTSQTGSFQASIPRDTEPGSHKIAVVDRNSALVGWADVVVTEPADPTPTPTPGPNQTTPPSATPPRSGGTSPGGTPPVCRPVPGPAASSPGAAAATPATSGEVAVGSEGHFDFGPVVEDGQFTLLVKDDRTAPPVWRDPATVVFNLGEAALRSAAEIPDDLSFIAPAGEDVYMIQQIQEPGVPWLGWNTQHETVVNGPGASGVQMTLVGVEGPGELAIFLNGNFGQLVGQRVVDTVGGPTSYTIPGNTHQHGNWVFTEPGVYAVTFTMSADGESVTSTLQFFVGQSDPAAAATSTAASSAGAQSASAPTAAGTGVTASGQPCTLAATGADTELGLLALASALVVLMGVFAVRASRRRFDVGR